MPQLERGARQTTGAALALLVADPDDGVLNAELSHGYVVFERNKPTMRQLLEVSSGIERAGKRDFNAIAFWAALDALGARDVLPDGIPDELPLMQDEDTSFDWLPQDPDGLRSSPFPPPPRPSRLAPNTRRPV